MKIAYTVNGLIGGMTGKNSDLRDQDIVPLIIKYAANTFNKFIRQDHDIDFYIFSWQPEFADIFDETYTPIHSVYTPQIKFNIPSYIPDTLRTQAHYSRWYGVRKLSNMIKSSNRHYDLILNCRMDLCWNRNINLKSLDVNKIHVPFHITTPHFLPQNSSGNAICDHVIATNVEYFHEIAKLFECLDDYVHPSVHKCDYSYISNHLLIPQHLRSLNLIDKLNATFINDHELGAGTGDYDIFRYKQLTYEQIKKHNNEL